MVYVDPLTNWGGSKTFKWVMSCHLYADSLDELHMFALSIGLKRKWFQDHRLLPHYDLNAGRRIVAVRHGATEVDHRELAEWIRHNRRIISMSVVNPNDAKNRTSDAAETTRAVAGAKDNKDGIVVDLFTDKSLPRGEKSKLDKNEDAWTFAPPPPMGRYPIKVMPAKDMCKLKQRDVDDPTKGIYYSIAMECKVLDPKDPAIHLATVFPYVNTIIGRGKSISTAAGMIGKLGYAIPEQADDYEVALLCGKAIKQEKVIDGECDWLGQYLDGKDYKTAWKSMNDFPRDAEGNPMHVARYRDAKGNEHEVTARFEVRHWYKKGEASIIPRAAGAVAGMPNGGIKMGNLVPIAEEPATQGTLVPVLNQPGQAQGSQGDADLLTLLEES